ncbi:hypothetical protein BC827DRAFT_1237826 [Russula dissimulans]|nr:hypothetical protein BC827DRAFT_1237826 [Russula dissimulans]
MGKSHHRSRHYRIDRERHCSVDKEKMQSATEFDHTGRNQKRCHEKSDDTRSSLSLEEKMVRSGRVHSHHLCTCERKIRKGASPDLRTSIPGFTWRECERSIIKRRCHRTLHSPRSCIAFRAPAEVTTAKGLGRTTIPGCACALARPAGSRSRGSHGRRKRARKTGLYRT